MCRRDAEKQNDPKDGGSLSVHDGFLDVCVFSPRTLGDALRITRRLVVADFSDDPCLLYVQGRNVRVETKPAMQWQADGELMGKTPFSVVVEPLAVRLLVPPP